MKMNRHKLVKTMWAVLLAAVVAGVGFWPAMSSFADGGTVNVKLTQTNPETDQAYTFRLFYIGGFNGPVFTKEGVFATSDADVSMPRKENFTPGEDGTSWEDKWTAAANTLKSEILTKKFGDNIDELATPVNGSKTFALTPGGTGMSINLPKDGLYLLLGEPVMVGDYEWTPVPTFLGMLNGSSLNTGTIAIKQTSQKVQFEYKVTKRWGTPQGEAASDIDQLMRPTEIKVKITYGDQIEDVQVLNKDNDWTFFWKTKETGDKYEYQVKDDSGKYIKKAEYTPVEGAEWAVSEITDSESGISAEDAERLLYYKVVQGKEDPVGEVSSYGVTNTLTTRTLKLKKIIVDKQDGDTQNETFVFKVNGKNDKGVVIYTNHISVNLGSGDDLEKETTVRGIPADVKTIEVTEVYSGNYKQVGDIVPVEVKDDDGNLTGWTVEVRNEHNGHGPKGGVVNKYRLNEKTEQDYGN